MDLYPENPQVFSDARLRVLAARFGPEFREEHLLEAGTGVFGLPQNQAGLEVFRLDSADAAAKVASASMVGPEWRVFQKDNVVVAWRRNSDPSPCFDRIVAHVRSVLGSEPLARPMEAAEEDDSPDEGRKEGLRGKEAKPPEASGREVQRARLEAAFTKARARCEQRAYEIYGWPRAAGSSAAEQGPTQGTAEEKPRKVKTVAPRWPVGAAAEDCLRPSLMALVACNNRSVGDPA